MIAVFTHVGSEVPDYTKYTIKQFRHTNPDMPIYFLCNYRFCEPFRRKVRSVPDLTILPLEIYSENPTLQEFKRVSWFKSWGKPDTVYPSPDNFVQGTSERLFVLNAFIKHNKFNNVWHFENDNLVYTDLNFMGLPDDKVTICHMGSVYVVLNAVFIPKHELFDDAVNWYSYQLSKGDAALKAEFPNIEMVQEMTVMRLYDKFNFFSSIPGEMPYYHHNGNDYFMDPASYGQFIAGTNGGHPPGFLDNAHHDIAKAYGNRWKGMSHTRQTGPEILGSDDKKYKLINLHMHNKTRIGEFVTYARTNADI